MGKNESRHLTCSIAKPLQHSALIVGLFENIQSGMGSTQASSVHTSHLMSDQLSVGSTHVKCTAATMRKSYWFRYLCFVQSIIHRQFSFFFPLSFSFPLFFPLCFPLSLPLVYFLVFFSLCFRLFVPIYFALSFTICFAICISFSFPISFSPLLSSFLFPFYVPLFFYFLSNLILLSCLPFPLLYIYLFYFLFPTLFSSFQFIFPFLFPFPLPFAFLFPLLLHFLFHLLSSVQVTLLYFSFLIFFFPFALIFLSILFCFPLLSFPHSASPLWHVLIFTWPYVTLGYSSQTLKQRSIRLQKVDDTWKTVTPMTMFGHKFYSA